MTDPDERTLADLTALADGTLRARRPERLLAEIGRSPEMAERYDKQRRAVTALRSVDERAPAWLRARLEPERGRRRRRISFSVPLAGGLAAGAAFAILLALLLPGGTGRRVDEIDGRRAVTVFYEKGGRRIGYTILSGDQIEPPDEASTANREGIELRGLSADGRMIVTWPRGGHTCVLSGTGVDASTLLDLAAWKGKGAVLFLAQPPTR